jgi:hypothetical protein
MMAAGLGKALIGTPWSACLKRGLICDPVNKAKSVELTEEGLAEAERLFTALFVKK